MSYQEALRRIKKAKESGATELVLSELSLESIPEELSQLPQLTKLRLDRNQISEIKGLDQLKSLTELRLESNQISEIKGLDQLTLLTELRLESNQISEIKGLDQLTLLTELSLDDNQISEIKGLEQLTSLTELSFSNNQISEIKGLEQLTSLTELWLYSNQISEIKGLEQLTSLTKLSFSSNQISEIKGLEQLTSLTKLWLYSNQIGEIKGLEQLTSLTLLQLHDNQISEIKGLEQLTSLRSLRLGSNHIEVIPLDLLNLNLDIKWTTEYIVNGLSVGDNPVVQPPIEIVEQGNEAIRRYWEQIAEEGVDYLYEAKLILVGDGGAGKTTLLHRLRGIEPEEIERTRGVDIAEHDFVNRKGKAFHLNIWDFGGQDIYFAIHRFFLTENSLYLLLTNTRLPEDNFDYWIPNIALFGGKSPIMVIKNLWDGFQRDIRIKRFLQSEFYYVINRVFEADLKGAKSVEELEDAIYHHVEALPHIGQPVPVTWIDVRNRIKEIAEEKPYISLEAFKKICKEQRIVEDAKIFDLAKYFHDLGIALWYKDITVLQDKVILQPEWVTNAAYKVIDDKIIQGKNGAFNQADLRRIWHDETYVGMHAEFLELMKAFRLCYKKRDKEEYIIPALLLQDEPGELWKADRCLQVQYEYLFMPRGIINQLTAELHFDIKSDEAVWSQGVILETDLAEAKIVEDWYHRRILIEVKGIGARGLMQVIMRELDLINQSYSGINVEKWVPCICTTCQQSDKPNKFQYHKLLAKLKQGKQSYFCNEGDEPVYLYDLLMNVGYKYNEDRQEVADSTALNIAFSYADTDQSFMVELEKHLSTLKRKKEIFFWSAKDILAGENRNEEIVLALDKADIIVQLLSVDYFSSNEIMEGECKKAMERHKNLKAHLIPVKVRSCMVEESFVKDLQVLPKGGEALSTHSNSDEVLVEVARDIMKVVNKIRKQKAM